MHTRLLYICFFRLIISQTKIAFEQNGDILVIVGPGLFKTDKSWISVNFDFTFIAFQLRYSVTVYTLYISFTNDLCQPQDIIGKKL